MTFYISNPAAIAACNAVVDLLDAGAGAGTIRIMDDSAGTPADADAAQLGVLLATLTFSATAYGGAVLSGNTAVATANAITNGTAVATGTALYFRALDSDNNVILQGTIGVGGSDLNMNSTAISSGATVSASGVTYTHPEAA